MYYFYILSDNYLQITTAGIIGFILLELIHALTMKETEYISISIGVVAYIGYVAALMYLTLWSRNPGETATYSFTPLWSYREIINNGDKQLLLENIQNIFVFIPMGMFMKLFFRKNIRWYIVMLIGLLASVAIELTQLKLKLGFFEFDDMLHNTLGTMIGCFIAWLIQKAVSKLFG